MSPAVLTTAHAESSTLNESPAKKYITFILISLLYAVSSPAISIAVEDRHHPVQTRRQFGERYGCGVNVVNGFRLNAICDSRFYRSNRSNALCLSTKHKAKDLPKWGLSRDRGK